MPNYHTLIPLIDLLGRKIGFIGEVAIIVQNPSLTNITMVIQYVRRSSSHLLMAGAIMDATLHLATLIAEIYLYTYIYMYVCVCVCVCVCMHAHTNTHTHTHTHTAT